VVIGRERMFPERLATHMLAYEGNSHFEWAEGISPTSSPTPSRGRAPDRVNNRNVSFKPLTR
jgi:hypothetical protein